MQKSAQDVARSEESSREVSNMLSRIAYELAANMQHLIELRHLEKIHGTSAAAR